MLRLTNIPFTKRLTKFIANKSTLSRKFSSKALHKQTYYNSYKYSLHYIL